MLEQLLLGGLTNSTVTELLLSSNNIGHAGASALGRSLTRNNTLERICLLGNNIGSRGAKAIANGLSMNHSIKWINLRGNGMGDEGAVAVVHMLTIIRKLREIQVGDFGELGLTAFITYLPTMQGLEHLTVENVQGFAPDTTNALVGALEENHVLKRLCLDVRLPRVNHLLALLSIVVVADF